jgi:hypoxanthine phosphoribosyltransferase
MFKPLTSNTPLACLPHDHSRCVADALAEAEALCAKQGTRLTTLRKRVLELGTFAAYSTMWLARALPEDGYVLTIEGRDAHAALAQENIDNAKLAQTIELQCGRAADLLRALPEDTEAFDFMVVSSYGGSNTVTSGLVKIIKDLDGDLSGKDVLIVEDILDTGVTLSNLVPMLKMRNPNSVKICTILDKPSRRKADIQPDYEGFQVPDEFVVGYGLDYDEKYRNLPYVGVLKPEIYTK